MPWESDWRLPIDALLRRTARDLLRQSQLAVRHGVPLADVEALASRTEALVLVDEAYADFAEGNCLEPARATANLLITRTLSKGYGLAGLRFGYAVGHPAVIAQMAKVKDSYNCDAIAIVAACAALDDQEYARASWQVAYPRGASACRRAERRRFSVIPKPGNFLLATTPGVSGRRPLYAALKHGGVLVRFFDKPALATRCGSDRHPEENDALLAALDVAFAGDRLSASPGARGAVATRSR